MATLAVGHAPTLVDCDLRAALDAAGIAYETVQTATGELPLLAPMSEVAGSMAGGAKSMAMILLVIAAGFVTVAATASEQSNAIRDRLGNRRSEVASVSRFERADGEGGFVLDRAGEGILFRWTDSQEVMVLSARRAAGGEAGRLALAFITSAGSARSFARPSSRCACGLSGRNLALRGKTPPPFEISFAS